METNHNSSICYFIPSFCLYAYLSVHLSILPPASTGLTLPVSSYLLKCIVQRHSRPGVVYTGHEDIEQHSESLSLFTRLPNRYKKSPCVEATVQQFLIMCWSLDSIFHIGPWRRDKRKKNEMAYTEAGEW